MYIVLVHRNILMCDIYLHNYLGYRLVILICLFVCKKLEVNSYGDVNNYTGVIESGFRLILEPDLFSV